MGDLNVGKSSIIRRIIYNDFNYYIKSGGQDEFFNLNLENSLLRIRYFDGFGQEFYESIRKSQYRRADAIILVYDVTNKESFEQCNYRFNNHINDFCKKNIKKLLLGNKCDEKEKRIISKEEGLEFASQYGYKFEEVSCLTNENIFETFEEFILDIYDEIRKNPNEFEIERYNQNKILSNDRRTYHKKCI